MYPASPLVCAESSNTTGSAYATFGWGLSLWIFAWQSTKFLIVLFFIIGVLIISHNFCNKFYLGKFRVLGKVCSIHVRKVYKLNLRVNLGFHNTQEKTKIFITIIIMCLSQETGSRYDGSHMPLIILTKPRALALGFDVWALVIIILIIKIC